MSTKKREILGNFSRDNGCAHATEPLKVNDHDYSTYSKGKMVQHTKQHLRHIYLRPKTVIKLCDREESDSAKELKFKWCLINTMKKLGINIGVAHYPTYRSKWNPIERRLFSQIPQI